MPTLPERVSLTSQICAILRSEIADGTWQGSLPGELVLARRLHVGRASLRAALDVLQSEGLLRVSKGKPREIVSLPHARSTPPLSRVVILSKDRYFHLTAGTLLWIDALRSLLGTSGIPLEFTTSAASSMSRPARRLEALVALFPGSVWLLLRCGPETQRWFASRGLPAVIAGSMHAPINLPGVDWDYFAACRHAATRLLARGAHRPAIVIPRTMLAGDRESEAGFRDGCTPHNPTSIQHDGSPDGLHRALDAAMDRPDAPDGLLVCHSTHTITVISRLLQLGRRIPHDIRIISRDDDPVLSHLLPQPARYAVPPDPFAARLARLILSWIHGKSPPPSSDLVLPEFIDGTSL
jgi:hypothetical protein